MTQKKLFRTNRTILFLFIMTIFLGNVAFAQTTTMKDFVLFGGNPSTTTGYVQLGSSSSVLGGSIGSYKLVKTTGSATIGSTTTTTNIYSGGTVDLYNSNKVYGKITAANTSAAAGNILSVGSSATLAGNIDINGNIKVNSGTVSGRVTLPTGKTYSGPTPAGGKVIGTPTLPVLPTMPAITTFQPFPALADINTTRTITPGAYDDIKLPGGKTLTFGGTGIYVFDLIENSGGTNNFVFDFQNNTTGTIKIYVHNNVNLDKISVTAINGGSASRIFTEVHGTGTGSPASAFIIGNGSSSSAATKWLGTVWAPYAAINIGSGSGNSSITGALWSGKQVNVQCGANIIYAPFNECSTPNANAGIDKPLDFVNLTTLTGTSTTSGVTFSWQAINGGVITSPVNAASITVSSAGTYILTATSGAGCFATDTAIVTGKNNNLIGSELQSIFQNYNPNAAPSPFFVIQNDSVLIDIITIENQYASTLALLTTPAYGLTKILSNGASNYIITGLYPIAKLPLLNLLTSNIVYVRPYYGALSKSGIVTSAGDIAARSNLVRDGYSLKGEGVKVGIISDSYNTITAATTNPITNTASQDVGNGDLPGPGNPNGNLTPVHVLKDYGFKSSDEGRAMLQIVHDIAPKAELYFRTGFNSAGDFALGIDELKQAGCNIIADDVTFITEPFLKDGVVAAAVDAAAAAGVTYFSAAGNFANKSYENTYNPVAAPGNLTGTAHSFGGTDVFQSVTLTPGNYTIVLQWLDDIYSLGQTTNGGTKNDLDIYLTPNTNGTALFGFNRNNTNGDPIEILPFTVTSAVTTNILITNNTVGSNPARFKYIVFRGEITFNEYATGTSTIVGQANALGAIAVGAVRFDKAPPFSGPLSVESFSSIGGTVINNLSRNKPDLVAPDGVNTTVNLGNDYPLNSDGYSNFFGTSAAAPHAAGVAALIMEGKKKYSAQNITTPAEIKTILQNSSTDMNTPGFDVISGAGFLNADSAMRTFAKPDPTLIQLVVPATVPTPGTDEFTLTVTGVNLSPTSIIRFRDSSLVTTFLNSGAATAVIPRFIGDPVISVYTPPVSASGLDGGTSDSLRFFSIVKKNITVTAENKTKKYAQLLPSLTASVLVDGVPLQNTTLTLADLGLDALTLTTLADVNSNIGTYTITPSRVFDHSNPVDVGLLELYNYTFNPGSVTVEKLPVTVTALGSTVTYGEKIPNITFTYNFDGTNIPDPNAFLNSLQATHQSQLAKDVQQNDILGLVNGRAVSIVNGRAVSIVNGRAVSIVNGRAVSIVNGRAVSIVNSQALTITNGIVTDTSGIDLSSAQVSNLSFSASAPALQNAREITNKTQGNVTGSTKVVDITQESILDFNNNSAQTYMLNAISDVSAKGLIDVETIANGRAVSIVNGAESTEIVNGMPVIITNGRAVSIVNGQELTIVNGRAVSIVNGQAVTYVNGQPEPIVNNQNRNAVVVDSSEIGQTSDQLKSLNMITGLDVGDQFIIPGSLVNENLLLSYIPGVITVLPASVTITPTAGLNKVYGEIDPEFTFANNAGLIAGDFTGALGRENGNNAGIYAYTLGNLTAGPNYALALSSGSPVSAFAISARPISITANANQSKVYGTNDQTFAYTASEALQPGDAYSGSLGRAPGETVAGSPYAFTLGSLSAGNNYTLSLAGSNTFMITKRPITITANPGQGKVYGTIDPTFAYTASEALQSGDAFSGSLGRAPGETVAGSPYAYTLGTLSAGNNYTLSLAVANSFAITTRQITITPTAGLNKIYGSNDPAFTFTNDAGLSSGDFTGALSRSSLSNNAGVYTYTLGTLSAGSNNNLSLATTSTFTINKAPLQVKAVDKLIFKGASLPTNTSIITGLKYTDNPTVVYSYSPSCTGSAGLYTIIPVLSASFTNAVNYTITYINATLYINPKGTGVDDVDTYLECVEDRGAAYLPANRRYVARFYSKNLNSTAVYVPIGSDNKLSSTSTASSPFDGSQQPVLFLSGDGATRFNVPFDGISLKWELKTYEGNSIVTESVTATKSSKKCTTTTVTRSSGTTPPEKIEAVKAGTSEIIPLGGVNVFPNPAKDRTTIYLTNVVIAEKGNSLFDVYGKSHPVKVIRWISKNAFEIDISTLSKGYYYLRLKVADGYKTVCIIKG